MAKRKSTGTVWVVLLIVALGLMTGIPREAWIALSAAILCMFFVWQNLRGTKRPAIPSINTDMQKTAAVPDLGDYQIAPSQLESEQTIAPDEANKKPTVDEAKKPRKNSLMYREVL